MHSIILEQAAQPLSVVSVVVDSGVGAPLRLLSAGAGLTGGAGQHTLPFSNSVRRKCRLCFLF